MRTEWEEILTFRFNHYTAICSMQMEEKTNETW